MSEHLIGETATGWSVRRLREAEGAVDAALASEVGRLRSELDETRKALRYALGYIDAMPKDVALALPTMPGIDRDWADELADDSSEIGALRRRVEELEAQAARLWGALESVMVSDGMEGHLYDVVQSALSLPTSQWLAEHDAAKDAEIARLKAQLAQVDDVLVISFVGPPKDGDYKRALNDLVAQAIAIHDDPRVSETARMRQEEVARLRATAKELIEAALVYTDGGILGFGGSHGTNNKSWAEIVAALEGEAK